MMRETPPPLLLPAEHVVHVFPWLYSVYYQRALERHFSGLFVASVCSQSVGGLVATNPNDGLENSMTIRLMYSGTVLYALVN